MYEGPSLAHVFDFEDSVRDLLHDLVDRGGDEMTANVREKTPVGKRPFESGYVPGHLLASISKKTVVVYPSLEGLVYESGTETDVDYAPYVENGTGLWGPARAMYEIRPKNPEGWLRFHDKNGNLVFAKRVLHQGSPGAHMFTNGASKTEEEFHRWAEARIRRWAEERDMQVRARAVERVLIS